MNSSKDGSTALVVQQWARNGYERNPRPQPLLESDGVVWWGSLHPLAPLPCGTRPLLCPRLRPCPCPSPRLPSPRRLQDRCALAQCVWNLGGWGLHRQQQAKAAPIPAWSGARKKRPQLVTMLLRRAFH